MSRRSRLVLVIFALVVLSAASSSVARAYDGATAATYADTYWLSYNPDWPSFAKKGGDCTNFVSQALYAGGIAMRASPPYVADQAWYMLQSKGRRWSYSLSWINVQSHRSFLTSLPGVTQVASYHGVAPNQLVASNAAQGDVVFYDWDDNGVYDHESVVVASDGPNPDGSSNWDLVDAHTSNRYHAFWTLAQYNASWATTRIIVLHIPNTTS